MLKRYRPDELSAGSRWQVARRSLGTESEGSRDVGASPHDPAASAAYTGVPTEGRGTGTRINAQEAKRPRQAPP